MNPFCECPLAGYCKRHQIQKGERSHQYCQGKGDKAWNYWEAWEQGRLGATAPKDPMLDPEKFGVDGENHDKSTIGTALHDIFTKFLGHEITCADCQRAILKLNLMTPEEANANRESIVADIKTRIPLQAPTFYKALAYIDGMLHTGQVESRLNGFLDEAITIGGQPPVRVPVKKKLHRSSVGVVKGANRSAFSIADKDFRFVTSQQLQHDIKTLISKLPSDIDVIAGVARSGLSVATMVAMYLHLPMVTIRQNLHDIIDTGNGWRLGGTKHIKPHGKVLVIDDTVMTGNSLKAIKPLVEKHFKSHIFAAVYVNPAAKMKPHVWAVNLPWPHLLEWNLFNSVISPSIAVDFDGILCHDCPPGSDDDGRKYLNFIQNAPPLYTPRRNPIPLIVTARIEKYRSETEAWLKKWRINYNKLIMHPAGSLRERERDDIPRYKAMHYAEWANNHKAMPGPILFIESEDWQAKRIAEISNKRVICPSTEKVY